jgi:2-polyprenyl-6-methoxyphenol hydroxylase-like FAD-dependent oxidoreductase
MQDTKVLIVGAGIAGTALADRLRRHGATPTVVERAPGIRPGGYKVDIRGAALDVVRRMGVLDDVRRLRTDVRGGSVVDATGRRVASLDGDTFGGRRHDDAEIRRGDLSRILYDLTRDRVEYIFGDSIAALAPEASGRRVTFAGGARRHFDLVVGADGLHSQTRALAFGPEDRYVRDLGYSIAAYSVPNHLGLDRWELTYVAPGRTAMMYSTARDAQATALFLFATPPGASGADRGDRAAAQRLLAQAYADESWEVPRLLDAMAEAPDFYLDSMSQVHMDRWSRGSVALVGDAAYCASPASGQGTSLALVGAYVLADELAHATDHATAFAAYERRMRPFVGRNQRLGPANVKRMVLRTRRQVRMSMAVLGLIGRLPGRDRIMAKAVEPISRAANAITLERPAT